MSYVIFNNLVDMTTVATPSNGYTIGYDLDGILKQKDQFGIVTPISSTGGGTQSLQSVLTYGNTTGALPIIVASGSSLITDYGTGQINFGSDTYSHVYITSDNGTGQESLIDLANNKINVKSTGNTKSINLGVSQNYSSSDYQDISIKENTFVPSSVDSNDRSSIFIGTKNSTFNAGVSNSVIIGGNSLTATQSNTVYLGNIVNINNAYKLPTTDGSTNQVLKTDGLGNVTWQNDATASTAPLSTVLSIGNTTGTNDIIINSGQVIKSSVGTARLDLGTTTNLITLNNGTAGGSVNINSNLVEVYVTSSVTSESNVVLGITNDEIRISSNSTFSATSSNTDKNTVFIGTRNSSTNAGITNSVVIGGQSLSANQSNTVFVPNIILQGNVLGKYTVQPSTQPGWDALSIPTKQYVDNLVAVGVTGNGSASYIPKWTGTSSLSATSSIFDSGFTVSVSTNMSINDVYVGRGGANIATNTSIGFEAINSPTSSGANNTAVGNRALKQNGSGYDNTAVGIGSLQLNVTGYKNTAVGAFALRNNSIGNLNTALGWYSLYNNTIGSENIAIGLESLYINTSGNYNISIGNFSLHDNTNGSYSVSIGYQSLSKNTTGAFNTSIGSLSSWSNLTGQYNVSLGYQSMYNSKGSNNTALGALSLLQSTTISNTVAVGFASLYSNTTGNNNTALGASAGYDSVIGNNNTFIGQNTGRGLTSGSNNTFLGANINVSAGTTGSIYISDGSGVVRIMADDTGKVGINTLTPYARLDIDGDLATRHKPVANVSGTLNDYSTSDTSFIVLQNLSGAPVYITGFDNGYRGKRLTISNIGPDPIVIQHNNIGSLIANRILTGYSGIDLTLLDNQSAEFIYDTIENIWRLSASTFETSGAPGPTGPTGAGFLATFTNGVDEISTNTYGLGGTISQNTSINGDGLTFSIGGSSVITFSASQTNTQFSKLTLNDGFILFTSDPNTIQSNYIQSGNLTDISMVSLDSNGSYSVFQSSIGGVSMYINDNASQSIIQIVNTDQTIGIGDASSNNRMVITDQFSSKGLVYFDDYSSNFTTYSLVTKGYVDSVIAGSGITPSLSGVLGVDNNSGTYSIIMGTSTSILSSRGLGQINLDYGGANQVLISNDGGLYTSNSQLYLSNGYVELSDYSTSGQVGIYADNIDLSSGVLGTLPTPTIRISSSLPSSKIAIGVAATGSSSWDVIKISQIQGLLNSTFNGDKKGTIISSRSSYFDTTVVNSAIIGGLNIIATQSNTVYLATNVNINNAYTLPSVDGTSGFVLTTDGSGNVTWGSNVSTQKISDIRNFTASVTETISHNLNTDEIIVQSYDNTGTQIIPGSIQITGTGSVDITMSSTLANIKTIIIG